MHPVVAQRQIVGQHETGFADPTAVQLERRGEVVDLPDSGTDGAVFELRATPRPAGRASRAPRTSSGRPLGPGSSVAARATSALGRARPAPRCVALRPRRRRRARPARRSAVVSGTSTRRPLQSSYAVEIPNRPASSTKDGAIWLIGDILLAGVRDATRVVHLDVTFPSSWVCFSAVLFAKTDAVESFQYQLAGDSSVAQTSNGADVNIVPLRHSRGEVARGALPLSL